MSNRTDEPKVQALAWLVSQLRWEHTLDDLRDARHAGVVGSARRAA